MVGKLKRDLTNWFEQVGEKSLREVGIRKGNVVLDFGCGSGNYAIPVARIVGNEGTVYALDKDQRALDELMQTAESEGLSNIKRIDTSGEVEIALENESVDIVLLYDIFWYFPLTDNRLPKLLAEVYRISTPDAMISVYPKHIDSEQLKNKIENAGFHLKDKCLKMLIHDGQLERGQILNFVKKGDDHTSKTAPLGLYSPLIWYPVSSEILFAKCLTSFINGIASLGNLIWLSPTHS